MSKETVGIIITLLGGFLYMIGTIMDDEEMAKNIRNAGFAFHTFVICLIITGIL